MTRLKRAAFALVLLASPAAFAEEHSQVGSPPEPDAPVAIEQQAADGAAPAQAATSEAAAAEPNPVVASGRYRPPAEGEGGGSK
jgi:hypothetical protein